jgi:beta-lactamase class A
MTPGLPYGRRAFIGGAGLTIFGACAPFGASAQTGKSTPFAEIEARLGGRLGVTAVDTGNGARLSYRGDERFAMCSSYKWVLAAMVLGRADQGEITLDQRVHYSKADLLSHSPVSAAHVSEGSLSLEECCAAVVEVSDNTAANALLKLVGGPAGLTSYFRGLGDPMTRLDRIELALNSNLPGDARDTTTPNAMAATMSKILVGDALSPAARARLISWMKNCRTGLSRIRAGLPPDWIVGDKTGTGDNGAVVDDAITWPPNGAPILIASYLSGSQSSMDTLEAAHAKIGGIVAAAFE